MTVGTAWKSFNKCHKPESAVGAVFISRDTNSGRTPGLVRHLPWDNVDWIVPAGPDNPNQWIGPVSKTFLRAQIRRLSEILTSITRYGFWMSYPDHPECVLLIDDASAGPDDYRVILLSGNHRTALLAYLGWSLIPMRPILHARETRLSSLNHWPGVVDGSFTKQTAEAIFKVFFVTLTRFCFPNGELTILLDRG